MNNVGGVRTDETKINNVSEKLHELIDNINGNMTTINQTLTSRIDWLSGDQKTNRVKINPKIYFKELCICSLTKDYVVCNKCMLLCVIPPFTGLCHNIICTTIYGVHATLVLSETRDLYCYHTHCHLLS